MMQRSLFDVVETKRRRDNGISGAARKHGLWLELTREKAVEIARDKGTVCADCLRAAGVETPFDASPNVWGAVFNDPRFVFAAYTHSLRPEAHHNLIRSWRLA